MERDVRNFFTSTDFAEAHSAQVDYSNEMMAAHFNAILREWLEAQPQVYGQKYSDTPGCRYGWAYRPNGHAPSFDTHSARLVDIQLLKGEKHGS